MALSQAITEASERTGLTLLALSYLLCILAPVSGSGRDLGCKDVVVPVNCSETPLDGALKSLTSSFLDLLQLVPGLCHIALG